MYLCKLKKCINDESGGTTIEFAIVLPVVMSIVGLFLAIFNAQITLLECQNAARIGARAAGITNSISEVKTEIKKVTSGENTDVSVQKIDENMVKITVSKQVLIPLFGTKKIEQSVNAYIENADDTDDNE